MPFKSIDDRNACRRKKYREDQEKKDAKKKEDQEKKDAKTKEESAARRERRRRQNETMNKNNEDDRKPAAVDRTPPSAIDTSLFSPNSSVLPYASANPHDAAHPYTQRTPQIGTSTFDPVNLASPTNVIPTNDNLMSLAPQMPDVDEDISPQADDGLPGTYRDPPGDNLSPLEAKLRNHLFRGCNVFRWTGEFLRLPVEPGFENRNDFKGSHHN